jgi:hypothetical protein
MSRRRLLDLFFFKASVADPGCLSWILIFTHSGTRIQHRDFYPSLIRESKTARKEEWKIICCLTFSYSHKFHKIKNSFIFEQVQNIFWANWQRIIVLFSQKTVTLKNISWGSRIRDPGSRKNLSLIPDPGVKKTPDPPIPDPDPQRCEELSTSITTIICESLYIKRGLKNCAPCSNIL